MRARIVKCTYPDYAWYAKNIGEIVEVERIKGNPKLLIVRDFYKVVGQSRLNVLKSDVELEFIEYGERHMISIPVRESA